MRIYLFEYTVFSTTSRTDNVSPFFLLFEIGTKFLLNNFLKVAPDTNKGV